MTKKIKLNSLFILLLVLSSTQFTACGRAGYPFSPEKLSSESVKNLQVGVTENAVTFTWRAPTYDQRGMELVSLDSYHIMRKPISKNSDIIDETISYEKIAEIQDRSNARLKEKQKEARTIGLPSNRVKPEEEYMIYNYSDNSIENGKRYVYQILPINQGNIEGEVDTYVDVTFKGLESSIDLAEAIQEE
jgi:hypothetical protein